MVAYSFQARFAEPILAGTKGGTIRAARKPRTQPYARPRPGGHAVPGEDLQLYTGMRTKQCRLIARKQCLEVEPIRMDLSYPERIELLTSKIVLRALEARDFAIFDGFESLGAMAEFWREAHGDLYFDGWHVRWLPLPEALRA